MMLTFRSNESVFCPPVRIQQEAESYEDFIARARKHSIKDEITSQEENSTSEDRPENHPNRYFDPQPFLKDGCIKLTSWEILGIQSLVYPDSANYPVTIRSILIDIHGASRSLMMATKNGKMQVKNHGTATEHRTMKEIDLACGVYFGPESRNNRGKIITDIAWKDKQGAYLYATIVALKKVTKLLNPLVKAHLYTDMEEPDSRYVKYAFRLLDEARKNIKLVVIRADTKILGYSLNKNIYKWLQRGFHNSKGVNRPGEPLFREIHELMVGLENKGVSVQFWGVSDYDTSDVEDMTTKLLDDSAARRKEVDTTFVEDMARRSVEDPAAFRGEVELPDENGSLVTN